MKARRPLHRPLDPYSPGRDSWLTLVDRLRELDPALVRSSVWTVAMAVGLHGSHDGADPVWKSMRRLRTVTGRRADTVRDALRQLIDLDLLEPANEYAGKGLAYWLTATERLYDTSDQLLDETQSAEVARTTRRRMSAVAGTADMAESANVRAHQNDVRSAKDPDSDAETNVRAHRQMSEHIAPMSEHIDQMSAAPGTLTQNPEPSYNPGAFAEIEEERVEVIRNGQRVSLSPESAQRLIEAGEAEAI